MNLLIVRFILYLIPCFLVQESTEFQIGLVAGVACSFMAYSLGKESTCTDKFIAIVMSTAAIVILRMISAALISVVIYAGILIFMKNPYAQDTIEIIKKKFGKRKES